MFTFISMFDFAWILYFLYPDHSTILNLKQESISKQTIEVGRDVRSKLFVSILSDIPWSMTFMWLMWIQLYFLISTFSILGGWSPGISAFRNIVEMALGTKWCCVSGSVEGGAKITLTKTIYLFLIKKKKKKTCTTFTAPWYKHGLVS